MILGSHNSWTFVKPLKWWMRILNFTAKCQDKNIIEQYEAGVRCFDLRLLPSTDSFYNELTHNRIRYKYRHYKLYDDLHYLNDKKDCYIRILFDARNKEQSTDYGKDKFTLYCRCLEANFTDIKFFGGNSLYDGETLYKFKTPTPTIEGAYGSARKPNSIYAIFPKLYAKFFNKKELNKGTDKNILMIDYV